MSAAAHGGGRARDALGASVALEMRAPLARVALAASQLARDAATPAARALAEGISDAVEDLDGGIAKLLALLLPAPPPAARSADLADVLAQLRERIEPALRARGVRWDALALPEEAPRGDPEQLRCAALALLRAGAERAAGGGRLALALEAGADRCALRLETRPAAAGAAPAADATTEATWQELRASILRCGGAVEIDAGDGTATAWLPCEGDACPAS